LQNLIEDKSEAEVRLILNIANEVLVRMENKKAKIKQRILFG